MEYGVKGVWIMIVCLPDLEELELCEVLWYRDKNDLQIQSSKASSTDEKFSVRSCHLSQRGDVRSNFVAHAHQNALFSLLFECREVPPCIPFYS